MDLETGIDLSRPEGQWIYQEQTVHAQTAVLAHSSLCLEHDRLKLQKNGPNLAVSQKPFFHNAEMRVYLTMKWHKTKYANKNRHPK